MSSTASQSSDIVPFVGATSSSCITVTFFLDQFAKTLNREDMTLPELRDRIIKKTAATKEELPWLKFATFGDKRSNKGSLRNDKNVVAVHGCEMDYDDEKMSFEEAVAVVKGGRLGALIYTSPSHSVAKPRWRLVFPTSRTISPEQRAQLAARANGLFGGIFAPESFTLSQSYFFGSVNCNPEHRAEIVDGDFIDLRNDLDAGAIYPGADAPKRHIRGYEAHLARVGDGPGRDGFHIPLRAAAASYITTYGAVNTEMLKNKMWEAINNAPMDKPRDYLTDDHLNELIDSADEKYGAGDDDIKRLNKIHAVLPIGGKTKVVTFGELEEFPGRNTIVMTQSIDDFKTLKNKYRCESTDAAGNVKCIPQGTYWLNSPQRRQFDGGMAFMPNHDTQVVGDKLNLWNGYGVKPIRPDGKSGAAGCNRFLDFVLKVICGGNEEHYDFLIKREATILQQRRRTEIALALHSEEEGVGKGFYERAMGRLLGNHAMQVINPAHVIGKFNPHLESLLRFVADEALFVRNHEHRNALFGLITEPLTIEHKFGGIYQAKNHLNLTITSNAQHFVPVGGTARRFFVPTVSADHMQDHEYFRAIADQLNDGGYEALLFHLLYEVDLRDFDVRKVPRTAGLAEQAALGRMGIDALVEDVCNTGLVPCPVVDLPGATNTVALDEWLAKSKDRELQRMSRLTITRRLSNKQSGWGCITKQIRSACNSFGVVRKVSVLEWPSLQELRERFVKKFGPQEWQHPEQTTWEKG